MSATPTPIPACAPVDNPELGALVGEGRLPVGLAVPADAESRATEELLGGFDVVAYAVDGVFELVCVLLLAVEVDLPSVSGRVTARRWFGQKLQQSVSFWPQHHRSV